jgi:hypothetical protein
MQVTNEIYKNVFRHWTFGLLCRHVWPNEELIWPNEEVISRCLEGQKPPFTRSLTAFYNLKSGFLHQNHTFSKTDLAKKAFFGRYKRLYFLRFTI